MTAMEAIDRELERLHNELSSFDGLPSEYNDVLDQIGRLISALIEVLQVEITRVPS